MVNENSQVVYRALSLGAGVQSSVLALLLSDEDSRLTKLGYPRPDCAVFADTGWEPTYVYDHLAWLEDQLSFPLVKVSAGDLKANIKRGLTASGHHFVDVPLYILNPDGTKGILRRQCTTHYKLRPIYREVRQRAGGQRKRPFPRNTHAEMWLGISVDEATRMKPSQESWVEHRWPLVDLGMSRDQCMTWFSGRYPDRQLPRSACVICPYRSDKSWIEMKELEPESYDEAVRFDTWLRSGSDTPIGRLLSGRPYLHAARRPLGTVIAERELEGRANGTTFDEECGGLCGV